jgi:hypothetical protein
MTGGSILGNVLLVAAVGMTILALAAARATGSSSGPDRAPIEILFCLLAGVRWLLVAGALCACIGAGKFAWVPGAGAGRYALVLAAHAGLGALVLMAVMTGKVGPHSGGDGWDRLLGIGAFAGYVVLPVVVIGYLFAVVNVPAPGAPLRWIGSGLAGLGAAGLVGITVIGVAARVDAVRRREQHDREMRAESAAEQAAWEAKQAAEDAELEVMDPKLPLGVWVVHTHTQYSEAHQERAGELIAQRPRLVEELTEMLGRKDAMEREYAVSVILFLKPPPEGLAGPVAGAAKRLTDRIRGWQEGRQERPEHALGMSRSILKTAQHLGSPEELRAALTDLLAVIEACEQDDEVRKVAAAYRKYLGMEGAGVGR